MMEQDSKKHKIDSFDPNGVGVSNNQLFGLPFTVEESEVIILPVPWEVSVSYRAGTAKGPQAILEASTQLDLYDSDFSDAWTRGIFMRKISTKWKKKNAELRKKSAAYIDSLKAGSTPDAHILLNEINTQCEQLKKWVYDESKKTIDLNKIPALLGGDHSTPLGLMEALGEKYSEFAILQIDAHADLRDAYEGFTYSHASIMYNAIKIPQIKKLIQIGLRDVCEDEINLIANSNRTIVAFFNDEIKNALYRGITFQSICKKIIAELPQYIYISFDIDGLDPKLCPNTGTPVHGGFEVQELFYLFNEIVNAGKQIIGFDLVEVAPGKDEWDANVGARILYKLANLAMKSNGK